MRTTNVFLYKFDISEDYDHIDVSQKYLGFSWEINGKLFTLCLLFYPSVFVLSPFIFTKVMPYLVTSLEKLRDNPAIKLRNNYVIFCHFLVTKKRNDKMTIL